MTLHVRVSPPYSARFWAGGAIPNKRSSAIIIYRDSLTAAHNTETRRESVFRRNPCAHNEWNRFPNTRRVDIFKAFFTQYIWARAFSPMRVSSYPSYFFFVTAQNIIKQGYKPTAPRISQSQKARVLLCLLLCQRVPG